MATESGLGKIVVVMAAGAGLLLGVAFLLTRLSGSPAPKPPPPAAPAKPAKAARAAHGRESALPAERAEPTPVSRPHVGAAKRATSGERKPAAAVVEEAAGGRPLKNAADFSVRLGEILALPSAEDRQQQLTRLGRELAALDFPSGLAAIQGLDNPDAATRRCLLEGLFRYGGETNPEAALAAAQAFKPPPPTGRLFSSATMVVDRAYRDVLAAAMRGWASKDPQSALAYASQLPAQYVQEMEEASYGAWAETAPADALASAGQRSAEFRDRMLAGICAAWSRKDPFATADYVNSLPGINEQHRNLLIGLVLREWAQRDVKQAVDWADASITNDARFSVTVADMAQGLAARRPAKAAEMLQLMPELAASQPGLIMRLADRWSQEDPRQAAAWAAGLADARQRAMVIKEVAGNWASGHWEDALAWAYDLPTDGDRELALGSVAARVGGNATEAPPTDWIRQLPPGSAHVRAAASYALGRLQLARDVRNASLLQSALGAGAVDQAAVQKLIQDAKVSDEEKQSLLGLF